LHYQKFKLRSIRIFIILSSISINLFAQDQQESAENKLGAWYIYNGFFEFSPKSEVFIESHIRTWETFSNIENYFFRAYYTYDISKQFQLGISGEWHRFYSYSSNPDNKVITDERRIGLQAMYFHKLGKVKMQHRYRYEFKYRSTGNLQRTRYRIQATVPLFNGEFKKGDFFFNTNYEYLLFTQPIVKTDQHRFFAAFGYQLSDNTNFQFGYFLQTPEDLVRHRLQFFFTHHLKLYKD